MPFQRIPQHVVAIEPIDPRPPDIARVHKPHLRQVGEHAPGAHGRHLRQLGDPAPCQFVGYQGEPPKHASGVLPHQILQRARDVHVSILVHMAQN